MHPRTGAILAGTDFFLSVQCVDRAWRRNRTPFANPKRGHIQQRINLKPEVE